MDSPPAQPGKGFSWAWVILAQASAPYPGLLCTGPSWAVGAPGGSEAVGWLQLKPAPDRWDLYKTQRKSLGKAAEEFKICCD